MPYEFKDRQGAEKQNHVDVKAELDRISDQLKEHGEKAIAEAEKGTKMAQSQKEQIDELLNKQGEFQESLKEVEQKLARRGNEATAENKSVGQRFVESDGFKAFQDKRGPDKYHMGAKAVTTVTSGSDSAGALVQNQRVENPMLTPGLRRLTVRDLIMNSRTSSNTIEYTQETGFQNNAAVQANEGDAKPQSGISYENITTPVVTIAHWIKVSKQILADAPRLQSTIDGRMTYGLKLKEEDQLLMGAGTSGNMNGLYTQATPYAQPAGAIKDGETATALDIIRLAILQAALAEYPVDGAVLNPTQWAYIELLKDTTGRHIIGNPQGSLSPTLWGRPVVETTAMTNDKFLVGAFGMGAEIFDREDAAVLVSTEDDDNFTKNLVTILCEERLAKADYRPEAFVKGDLNTVAA